MWCSLCYSWWKFTNSWILDFGCSFHMYSYKEWFGTYKECDTSIVWIDNDLSSKIIEICIMKVKMFDDAVRILTNVKHVPKLMRNLISLGALDTLGYAFSIRKQYN